MMNWNQVQQQWQSDGQHVEPGAYLAALQERDRKVRSAVRRRDALETAAALLMLPLFIWFGWRAGAKQAWGAVFFCTFIVGWLVFVPWRLAHVRRGLMTPQCGQPLIEYLKQERVALIAQARMLEDVWRWYLGPAAFGAIGLSMSLSGINAHSLIYAALVLVLCAVVARLNHHAARTKCRDLAAQIEHQISALSDEDGQPNSR